MLKTHPVHFVLNFGTLVKDCLYRRHLTQKQFCEEHHYEVTYFSRVCSGKCKPSLEYAMSVLSDLGVRVGIDDPKLVLIDCNIN